MAVPAVVFAGISKGGFGSGAAFASASILALVLPPEIALGLMLPLLMLIDVSSLPSYWRKWDWPVARILLIGGVPGTVLGALFLAWANPDAIRLLIGVICLAFVAWQAAQKSQRLGLERIEFGQKAGLTCGVGLGFTSYVSHAGGPAAAIYMLGRGLDKTTYQATTVLVFWAINLLKSFFYAGLGVFTRETLLLGLALAPFAVLGTWIGIKAHHRVPAPLFFAITYVLLTLTGIKLIWDAVT
ncbi:sulfite exporter TauE/SafE family protein [Thalassococcus lentus]